MWVILCVIPFNWEEKVYWHHQTLLTSSPIWYLRDKNAFPEPDLFNPYRWIDGSGREFENNLRDQFYIPFSKGTNICIGLQSVASKTRRRQRLTLCSVSRTTSCTWVSQRWFKVSTSCPNRIWLILQAKRHPQFMAGSLCSYQKERNGSQLCYRILFLLSWYQDN